MHARPLTCSSAIAAACMPSGRVSRPWLRVRGSAGMVAISSALCGGRFCPLLLLLLAAAAAEHCMQADRGHSAAAGTLQRARLRRQPLPAAAAASRAFGPCAAAAAGGAVAACGGLPLLSSIPVPARLAGRAVRVRLRAHAKARITAQRPRQPPGRRPATAARGGAVERGARTREGPMAACRPATGRRRAPEGPALRLPRSSKGRRAARAATAVAAAAAAALQPPARRRGRRRLLAQGREVGSAAAAAAATVRARVVGQLPCLALALTPAVVRLPVAAAAGAAAVVDAAAGTPVGAAAVSVGAAWGAAVVGAAAAAA